MHYSDRVFLLELVARCIFFAKVLIMAIDRADPGVFNAPPEEKCTSHDRLVNSAHLVPALRHVGHVISLQLVILLQLGATNAYRVRLKPCTLLIVPHNGQEDRGGREIQDKVDVSGQFRIEQDHDYEGYRNDEVSKEPRCNKLVELGGE